MAQAAGPGMSPYQNPPPPPETSLVFPERLRPTTFKTSDSQCQTLGHQTPTVDKVGLQDLLSLESGDEGTQTACSPVTLRNLSFSLGLNLPCHHSSYHTEFGGGLDPPLEETHLN